jgi:Ca2+-binding EF-hand superfamily protein
MMIVEEAAVGGRETLARIEESVQIHCRLFDTDQDQRLSLQDYTIWLTAWGITSDAERHFRHLDLDGDGYLHQSEIVEYLRQFHFSNDPEAPGNRFYGPFQ